MKNQLTKKLKRFLVICVMTTAVLAGAHDINLEAFSQAVGKPVLHDGRTNLIVLLSKERYDQVNTGRKLSVRKRVSFEEVNRIPWINREYLDDALTMIETDLKEQIGPRAQSEYLFYAWIFGEKALKKANWNLEKFRKEEYTIKWRLYASVADRQKLFGIPNPLPVNTLQPMPRRFGEKQKGEGG